MTPTIRRLALVLGAAIALWAILAIVRTARGDRISGLSLAAVDTAAVDTVTLTRPGDTAVLVRGAAGWTVNGFAVDTSRVRELLRSLQDSSRWSEQVSVAASSHHRLQVDSTGLRMRVITGASTPIDLVVGKRTADYFGVYVRQPTADVVYAVHGADFAGALSRAGTDWRSRRIATVTADSVGTVELRRGARTSTLRRSGSGWTVNNAPADSAAVAALLRVYHDLNADGFPSHAQMDSIAFGRHAGVSIRSRSGAMLLSLSVDSTAAGIWTRTEPDGTVYRLDAWQMSHLIPADSTLRTKRKR